MDNAGNSNGCDCKGCTGRGTKRASTAAQTTPKAGQKSTSSIKPGASSKSTLSVKPGATLKSTPSTEPGVKLKSTPSAKPGMGPKSTASSSKPGVSPRINPSIERVPLPLQIPRPIPVMPDTEKVDEEGTEDLWRILVDELEEQGTVDKSIAEPDSIDWCLEHLSIAKQLDEIATKPSWMPRVGEIILFVRNLAVGTQIIYNHTFKTFTHWDQLLRTATPIAWEAGVLIQLPEGTIPLNNLVSEQGRDMQVNYSGFRIEPMPEVGNPDKPWSKRPAYVPLHQIRPFNFWHEYTKGTPAHELHPTINHTLTAMSSFSLLHKFHFKGRWPDATIFSKGMYIGAELIMVGDVARILPTSDAANEITDVLHITSIKMRMINLDGGFRKDPGIPRDDDDELPPRWNTCIHFSGVCYTNDVTRAIGMGKLPLTSAELPKGIEGYGPWYHLHDPAHRFEVSFVRVLGRCYEDTATSAWFPIPPAPASSFATVNKNKSSTMSKQVDLSLGIEGVIEARAHSTATDPRIVRANGKTWFWGDSRVDQLDLHSMHGHDVGAHSRYGDDGIEGTLPRQAMHLEAMKKAKGARERGLKGPHGFKGEKSVAGSTPRFAASGMLAGGQNAIPSAADDEGMIADKDKKRSHDIMDESSETGGGGVLRMSQIDQADDSGDELDDDELIANQLGDELTSDATMKDGDGPAKRVKVIELD